MSYPSLTYQRFVHDELIQINQEFNQIGYKVHHEDDINTYKGWKDEGRKVKTGEKGLKVTSHNRYIQPIITNGSRVYENGKQAFAKFNKTYVLFHFEQTESVIA